MSSDVYRIWEDAKSEKSLVITKDSNPQYAYVANYPWLFFADDQKLHVLAYFYEEPEVECRVKVKIWYANQEFQFYERKEPFPFHEEQGDTYEFDEPNWQNIEVSFKVEKLHGEVYEGLEDPEDVGVEMMIGDKRFFLDLKMLEQESEMLKDLKEKYSYPNLNIFEVDPEIFLEMLRVIQPPYKRISRHNFPDLFLLAFRFRMPRLLAQLDEFSKTPDFDRNWMSKLSASKVRRLLEHEHNSLVPDSDCRVKRQRSEKPLKTVRIREPEVESVYEDPDAMKRSWIGHVVNWCSNHKTRIIFILLFFMFLENLILFVWFLCVYREKC